MIEALGEAAQTSFTHEDIEKSIVSCYGNVITPLAPQDRGKQAFETFLYANNGFKQQKTEQLLSVKDEDVVNAAKRLAEQAQQLSHKVIFCDKSKKSYGKNLDLPL